MSSAGKMIVVMLESLAGTGHKVFRSRPKNADKLEFIYRDPFVEEKVLYREKRRMKTLKTSK